MRQRISNFVGKGFTLIELLVVIAIISLLVSILLPSLKKAKELARKSMCAANLHSIGTGLVVWSQDNDGRLPYCGYSVQNPALTYFMYQNDSRTWDRPNELVNLGLLVADEILGDFTSDGILRCPSNNDENEQSDSRGDSSHPNYAYSSELGTWLNLRTAYLLRSFSEDAEDKDTYYNGRLLSDVSSDQALYADSFGWSKHITERHGDGVNVLKGSMAVTYVTDSGLPWLTHPGRYSFQDSYWMYRIWEYLEEN